MGIGNAAIFGSITSFLMMNHKKSADEGRRIGSAKENEFSFRFSSFRLLASERAALSETSLTTGRLAENGRASSADNDGLGV